MQKENTTTVVPKEDLQSALSNNTIKGVLTRVFKLFLKSFGKDKTAVWNHLMECYVNDPNNNIPNDRSKQTSAKGNAKREYLAPQLSWTKFAEAMRFAQFEKLEIIFIVTDRDGQKMKLNEVLDFTSDLGFDQGNELINDHVQQADPGIFRNEKAGDARTIAIAGGNKPAIRGRDWLSRPKVDLNQVITDNTVKSTDEDKDDTPF